MVQEERKAIWNDDDDPFAELENDKDPKNKKNKNIPK